MPLKIISLNVASIVRVGRRTLLNDFINNNPADIYLLQETHLDNKSKLFFPKFNIIRGDVKRGRGGTALFIRHGIPIRNISIGRNAINFTSCEIKIDSAWFRIYSIYVTHGHTNIADSFANLFNSISPSIMGGDFNARHSTFGDTEDNFYGTKLVWCASAFNLAIHNPPSPTCFHAKNGSYIDKFITHNFSHHPSTITVLPSFSDHCGISLSFDLTVCEQSTTPPTTKNFHLTCMNALNRFIERRLSNIQIHSTSPHSNAELDSIALNVDNIFRDSIKKIVPQSTHTNKTVILSATTRALQNESKRLQRLLFRAGPLVNTGFTQHIRRKIVLLRNMIGNSVNNECSGFFCNLYDNVQNSRDAFKLIKRHTGLKTTSSPSSGLYTDPERSTLLTDVPTIADSLGTLFAANHQLSTTVNSPHSSQVAFDNFLISGVPNIQITTNNPANLTTPHHNQLNNNSPLSPSGLLTYTGELNEIIQSRPNKKSAGHDSMPYFLIKRFSPSIILFLTTLFNHCIANAHFPTSWKYALVTPIPKPGKDASIRSNWRPISQLNCVSKLFEKVLMRRINNTIKNLGIFQNQFGFLSGHSTEHALARLQSDIDSGLNNKQITSILSLDLRAAFDVVWHDGLIHKLCKLGFNPLIIKLIKSMLNGRTFSVRLDNYITKPYDMPAGVPQGSVSGPTLFNLYLFDIPMDNGLKCTQFADDTSFYITHNRPGFAQCCINRHLVCLSKYFNDWKMILNHSKTDFINILGFTRDTTPKLRRDAHKMTITTNGHVINHSKSMRFLGLHLQCNNRFSLHIDNRLKKAKFTKFKLARFFKRRNIPTSVRSSIYKLYVRPIVTYAAPVWCRPPNVTSHQMEKLRLFERGILRTATGSTRPIGSFKYPNATNLYRDANCLRIDRYIGIRHVGFYSKLRKKLNPKFTGILAERPPGNGTYPKIDLIHTLNESGQLILNDSFSLFNKRYNGSPGSVYSLNQ